MPINNNIPLITKGNNAGPARLKSPILYDMDVNPNTIAISVRKTPRKKFIFFMRVLNILW